MTPPSSFYKSVGRFWSSFGRFLAVFGCFSAGFWATHRTNQKLPKLFYKRVLLPPFINVIKKTDFFVMVSLREAITTK